MTHYNLKKSIGKKLVKHECETQKANDESNTVESPKKGHFGTNINSSGLSNRDCPLLKRFQLHYIDRGVKIWGFSFVHCREIFNTVSLIWSVPLREIPL